MFSVTRSSTLRTTTGASTANTLEILTNANPSSNLHLYRTKYLFSEARFFIEGIKVRNKKIKSPLHLSPAASSGKPVCPVIRIIGMPPVDKWYFIIFVVYLLCKTKTVNHDDYHPPPIVNNVNKC